MAVVSRQAGNSNAGFTLRHENDTTDTVIPVYPSKVTPSNNIVGRSWNDMNGQFKQIPINWKLKMNWVFEAADEAKARQMLNGMIYTKIQQYKSNRFVINANFPGIGWIKSTFYLGTPDNIDTLGGFYGAGNVSFVKFEIHWIETEGVSLL